MACDTARKFQTPAGGPVCTNHSRGRSRRIEASHSVARSEARGWLRGFRSPRVKHEPDFLPCVPAGHSRPRRTACYPAPLRPGGLLCLLRASLPPHVRVVLSDSTPCSDSPRNTHGHRQGQAAAAPCALGQHETSWSACEVRWPWVLVRGARSGHFELVG